MGKSFQGAPVRKIHKTPIQHSTRVSWRSPLAIRAPWLHKHLLENFPLGIGKIHASVCARKSTRAVSTMCLLFPVESIAFIAACF